MTTDKMLEELIQKAEAGEVDAQISLGFLYSLGIVIHKDDAKAKKWFRRAADQGSAEAQYCLALLYLNSEEDISEAITLLEAAAKQEHTEAQCRLGDLYFDDADVDQDHELAAQWYHKAALQGNVEAQYQLGLVYSDITNDDYDFEQAYFWFAIAAENGDELAPESKDEIAELLYKKQRDKIEAEAKKWLQEHKVEKSYRTRLFDHPAFKRLR